MSASSGDDSQSRIRTPEPPQIYLAAVRPRCGEAAPRRCSPPARANPPRIAGP